MFMNFNLLGPAIVDPDEPIELNLSKPPIYHSLHELKVGDPVSIAPESAVWLIKTTNTEQQIIGIIESINPDGTLKIRS